jgi:hypothetical protein
MRYLLLIYGDENAGANASEADQQAVMQEWFQYTEDLRTAGVMQGGEALQPTSTATTVVDDGGKPLVTDGPFAETREQLGGFYMLDCSDLDEALAWARKIPMPGGKCEVRPVMDYEAAGSTTHENAGAAQ